MTRELDATIEQAVAERVRFALEEAERAGALTLRYFRADDLVVETKGDASPVTIADRQAEAQLRDAITSRFPGDGVLGEEHGERSGGDFRWILDPIDGTESFIRGVPLFGTLIGLERCGEPIGGVLHLPALAETLHAWRGHGAWATRGGGRPRPARVSSVARWDQALLCTTSERSFRELDARTDAAGSPGPGARGRFAELYGDLSSRSRKTRGWGDCYAYSLVATGRAEIAIDPRMSIWDSAALLPILEEAGGCFTDWNGTATIDGGNAVATNGRFHEEVVARLRSALDG